MIGRGTAAADNPLLTARPPGPRVATRIVVDTTAALSPASQLAQTARDVPVLVAVGSEAPRASIEALAAAGCELFVCEGDRPAERLDALLAELGRRRMTNVLVEGGAELLGSLFDAGQIDEVHAFVAPKLVGGRDAPAAIGGHGLELLAQAARLADPGVETRGGDLYIRGRIERLGNEGGPGG
jgi:diaminohydroxyphosphoribosylaminopyrimidine deaminase/5-amino-6-(5-phosphoribosylamino)uracil reductase